MPVESLLRLRHRSGSHAVRQRCHAVSGPAHPGDVDAPAERRCVGVGFDLARPPIADAQSTVQYYGDASGDGQGAPPPETRLRTRYVRFSTAVEITSRRDQHSIRRRPDGPDVAGMIDCGLDLDDRGSCPSVVSGPLRTVSPRSVDQVPRGRPGSEPRAGPLPAGHDAGPKAVAQCPDG